MEVASLPKLDFKMSPAQKLKVDKEVESFNKENASARVVKRELGKEDFLKLMIVQAKNQDPLEPMKNTESIAQLAQFSALEQMRNVSKGMDSMSERLERLEAQSLVGKSVQFFSTAKETVDSGTISKIHFEKDRSIKLQVGDEMISLEDVQSYLGNGFGKEAQKMYENNVGNTYEPKDLGEKIK